MTLPPARPRPALLLAAICALALALRLFHLDSAGLWGDEISTLQFAALPLSEIWGADTMPPLYYALVKAWRLLGEDEWTLRLSSALLGTAALPLVYLTGRTLGGARGTWLGLLAALLVATAPMAIQHAQSLRMYALLMLAAALALCGFARLLADPPGAAAPIRRGPARGAWLLYGGGAILALYTHNTGFLLPLSASLVAVVCWLPRPELGRLARNWTLVNLAVLLLWAPYWPWLFAQAEGIAGDFWAVNPDVRGFVAAMAEIHGGGELDRPALAAWILVAFLGLALAGLYALRRRPRWIAFTLGLALLPPLAELAIGLAVPIFVPRTMIWTLIPSSLLLAAGLLWLLSARGRLLAAALLAVLLLLAGRVLLLQHFYASPKTGDWRAAVAFLLPRLQDDSVIVVLPDWDRYTPGFHLQRLDPGWNRSTSLIAGPPTLDVAAARRLLAEPRDGGVWVIHPTWRYTVWLTQSLLHDLGACAAVGERQTFYGIVVFELVPQHQVEGC